MAARPFNVSPLDAVPRNMGVEKLTLAGVQPEGAPEAAARSTAERGYTVFLLADGCDTLDPAEQEATFRGPSWTAAHSTAEVVAGVAHEPARPTTRRISSTSSGPCLAVTHSHE
jgi:nicotinamidase-related amidase